MGNTSARMRAKNERLVRVTKVDGKTLEFHAPLLVKDLLTSHPNYYVGAFREATQPLPPNYKLRVGRVYHLLPLVNAKRVKVVLTKQQLQRLMARQAGIDEVLLEGSKLGCMVVDQPGSRVKRVMDPIPEEVELVSGG